MPTKVWERKYPRISKDPICRDPRAYKQKINPIVELSQSESNARTMRSYKAMMILIERRNLRVVCNAFPTFLETSCKRSTLHLLRKFISLKHKDDKIYKFLQSNEQGNLYHVGRMIEGFLKFSPDYNFYFIMLNCTLFNLLEYLYNPVMF